MLEEYKEKQKVAFTILSNAIKNNKTSHAYLFETNGYQDGLKLAVSFAKSLLCPNKFINNTSCVNCTQCINIDKDCFVELKIIKPDGLWIKKEQLDELQKEFSMKSIESDKKIYIIEQADRLNSSSANTILKFLEEPAENIIAILLADNSYQVLETIVSRCQIISLHKNTYSEESSMIDKLKLSISIPEDIVLEEKIDAIVQFIESCETKKIETLLFTQKLWHENITGKEQLLFAFDIMILLYKDIMNIKIGRKLEFFDKYNSLKNIADNNEILQINKKIETIIELKENIKYNANAQLLIDKLVMELVGGVK